VGDVHDREAEALLQGADFLAHRSAAGGIEVGEGFVEQQHLRLQHERRRPRRAAAGRRHLGGQARAETLEAHRFQRGLRAGVRIALAHPPEIRP
jgi:hypothetical protein